MPKNKTQQAGENMMKTGGALMGCGCLVTVLVVVAAIIIILI